MFFVSKRGRAALSIKMFKLSVIDNVCMYVRILYKMTKSLFHLMCSVGKKEEMNKI